MMLTPKKGVIYPVAIGRVNGRLCRIFLDTGTGGCYASSKLIEVTRPKCVGTTHRKVEMLLHSTSKSFDQYELLVENLTGDFAMKVCASKVNKEEILQLENPCYKEVIKRHQHLKGVLMAETSDKDYLPVHLILGSGDFARLKTKTVPKIGSNPDDPVAELTKLGWVMYSSGVEDEVSRINFINTSNPQMASDTANELYANGTDNSKHIKDCGAKPSQGSNRQAYAKKGFKFDDGYKETETVDLIDSYALCDTNQGSPEIHVVTQQESYSHQDMVETKSRLSKKGDKQLTNRQTDVRGDKQKCDSERKNHTYLVDAKIDFGDQMEKKILDKSLVVTKTNDDTEDNQTSIADTTNKIAINADCKDGTHSKLNQDYGGKPSRNSLQRFDTTPTRQGESVRLQAFYNESEKEHPVTSHELYKSKLAKKTVRQSLDDVRSDKVQVQSSLKDEKELSVDRKKDITH